MLMAQLGRLLISYPEGKGGPMIWPWLLGTVYGATPDFMLWLNLGMILPDGNILGCPLLSISKAQSEGVLGPVYAGGLPLGRSAK